MLVLSIIGFLALVVAGWYIGFTGFHLALIGHTFQDIVVGIVGWAVVAIAIGLFYAAYCLAPFKLIFTGV